jgi:hypothetical protein
MRQFGQIVKKGVVVVACLATAVLPASAQQIEASFFGGYTASEGINFSQSRPLLGQTYNSLDITSGGNIGLTAGVYIGPNFEVEFLWNRQFSAFEISNPAPTKRLASMNVDNYHGNVVYNWGPPDAKMRPYFFGGLGATRYIPGDYDSSIPNAGSLTRIQSASKFSSTWGGGVKYYANPHVGVKGQLRWTPTYIKTDSAGLWCDPFYPTCWVVGNPDYSNQFEFSGGVTVRFGGR